MSANTEYGVRGDSSIHGPAAASPQDGQSQIFARAAALLAQNGVTVQGSGGISLSLNESGAIVVEGDVLNKEQVTAALNEDDQLKSLLAKSVSPATQDDSQPSGSDASLWPSEAFDVSLSDTALSASAIRSDLNVQLTAEQMANHQESEEQLKMGAYFTESLRIQANTVVGGLDLRTAEYDEMGFSGGKDVAFSTALFDSLDERNNLYNYLQEKITAAVPGLDNIAGLQFDLKQDRIDSPYYVVAKNYKYDDETLATINNLIRNDSTVINVIHEGEDNLETYKTVLNAVYEFDQQKELGIQYDQARWQDSGVRFYSPVTDENKASVAAASEIWNYAQSLSSKQLDLLFYQGVRPPTDRLVFTRSKNEDGGVSFNARLCDVIYDGEGNEAFKPADLTCGGDMNTRDLIQSFCGDNPDQLAWANSFDESTLLSHPIGGPISAESDTPAAIPVDVTGDATTDLPQETKEEQELPATVSSSSWSFMHGKVAIPTHYDKNLEQAKEMARVLEAIQEATPNRTEE